MVSKDQAAEIVRLFHVEKWKIGTIAHHLCVHHEVVERILRQDGLPRPQQSRPSKLTPYIPFIVETFKKYPRLTATRLYVMCRERGYRGGPDHFRHVLSLYRPRPPAEAYLRLKTLPAEQAQVDWAHFGKVTIGSALRPLMAFVLVLSWSRRIFLRFFLGQQTENFLRGHEAAFTSWNGLSRVVLYDNLKSAVLERSGDAIRFNPTLLDFARHYRFEPRPVAPYRGNEKGRVERAIRYVRGAFFAARPWKNLDDLNRQAREWCEGEASHRRWPEDSRRTVGEAFAEEQPRLLPLPETSFPVDERREVKVGKVPYVRFDGNDYSIPHTLVRRTLCVVASLEAVRVFDGNQLVAEHPRSFDRRQQIENPDHIEELVQYKRQARKHRGMDRLAHAAPSSQALLVCMAERGQNLGAATAHLLRLLERYGAGPLETAIAEALQGGTPHPQSVRHILERNREEAGRPPVIPVELPDNPAIRNLSVQPHPLSSYDPLTWEERQDDNREHDDDQDTASPASLR